VQEKYSERQFSKMEIVDLTTMCLSFPEIACSDTSLDYIISRDNVIDTIDKMFSNRNQIVFVEGEEGIGRTTLLAQYAKKHSDNTFSLFIKPSSKWGFDPLALQYDICNQLSWFFYKEPISNPDFANDTYLRSHFLKLQQICRIYKKTVFFVIDGLEDIPCYAQENREIIIDMLPFSTENFKFLISAELYVIPEDKRKNILYKTLPLVEFTYNEVEKFFSDISVSKEALDEIYNTFRGIPGKLSTVKRILKTGIDINTFINEMPSRIPDLFELEWNNVEGQSELLYKILAVFAFDDNIHDISFIANIFNIKEEEIISLLKKVSFICVEPESDIHYVSNGFRNFAKTKLLKYKDEINELIVEYLINKPDSEENLKFLPKYLEKAGRHNEIIQYLSPERFDTMFQKIQSINIIEQMINLGFEVSEKLNRDGDIIRFGLYKSILRDINGIEAWQSQIEALMALKDYDSAITLMQSTVLKENRLHLLAIIVRKKMEHGLTPEPELVAQIRDLYKQIDVFSLGNKVLDIASDLIFSVPDIAIELVEKTNNSDMTENALDWAFANLSIASISGDSKLRRMDVFENLNSKIKNPDIKKFTSGVSMLFGNYSGNEVISEVEKLEDTSERLYLLCQWVRANSKNEGAFDVIDYALKLIWETTAYAPNAKIFKDLSLALPYIDDLEKVKHIIDILDSQKKNIDHIGPTEEYVSLQLLLAESEKRISFSLFASRMEELYLYICYNITDYETKINCLAKYVSLLQKVDSTKDLEKPDKIHTLANEDLSKSLEFLLDSTAEHFNVSKSIINSLGQYKPDMSFEIASSLNTINRRDLAYGELIKSYIKNSVENIDFEFIRKVLSSIFDRDIKSVTLMKIIERISDETNLKEEIIEKLISFLCEIKVIPNLVLRCKAFCLLYCILQKNEKYKKLQEQILMRLNSSWNEIDVLWVKIDVCYKIVEAMAENNMDVSKQYLQLAEEIKKEVVFNTSTNSITYITCIKLAIRAFSGLLPRSINTDNDIERIEKLIKYIPSAGEQAELWSTMALYCYINNKMTEFHYVYDRYVKPLVESISKEDVYYADQIKCNIAPTMYIAHKLTAFRELSLLPPPDRDLAYYNICNFIMNKGVPSDPYDDFDYSGKSIDYSSVLDICEILELMDEDSYIYSIISDMVDCISNNRTTLTREQKSIIIMKLNDLNTKKLPNKNFIKHDGYKIISLAQLYRISRPSKEEWNKIIDDAYAIPNLADRSFVLCILASIANNIPLENRRKLVSDAKNLIDAIPSTIERIDHYKLLSSLVWNVDAALCKDCLTTALKSSFECKDKNIYTYQRRIIDLAYRLDPDLASSLASISDDDIARAEMKRNIQHRHILQKLKKNMIDSASHTDITTDKINKKDYIEVMWMMLSALNSGRISSLHIQHTREYLIKVYGLSLTESYPAYAWAIQNAIKRLSLTDQSSVILRPIFEATILVAEFARRLAIRTSSINKKTISFFSNQVNAESILINAGQRDFAISYIINWFEKNLKDYLIICDPYFGIEELEILKYVRSICSNCEVYILTSIKHLKEKKIEEPWHETYKNYWRMKISDQDPPNTKIYAIGTKSQGLPPFHDRWWLTNGVGLRMGSSFNQIGVSKSSEISILSENETQLLHCELEQYISMTKNENNGERIEYIVFMLI